MDSAESSPLFAPASTATLRMVVYVALAIMLMVADHRAGWLDQVRSVVGLLGEPLYRVAQLPGEIAEAVYFGVSERQRLAKEADVLREELLLTRARLNRMRAVQRENSTLRELLGAAEGLGLRVQLAELVSVDLDPFRHRVVLNLGTREGIRAGMPVVDAFGVMGQVERVNAFSSQVLLLSDPAHAIPVQNLRSGLRLIAYGTGDARSLRLPTIPLSADVESGDLLVTSGLGGRFPAGFPVAEVVTVSRDRSGMFLEAEAIPVAALDRSHQVLVLWSEDGLPATAVMSQGDTAQGDSATPPLSEPDEVELQPVEQPDSGEEELPTPVESSP